MINHIAQVKFSRNLVPYVLGALFVFAFAIVQGFGVTPEVSKQMAAELKKTLEPIASLGPAFLLVVIFINNAVKAFMAIVLGIFAGLPSLFFIGMNGFAVGWLVAAIGPGIGWGVVAAGLAPHGILEVPIMLVATALGMVIGVESMKWIFKQKSEVRQSVRYGVRIYMKWLLAGLFIAALIEVFITPHVVYMMGGTGAIQ